MNYKSSIKKDDTKIELDNEKKSSLKNDDIGIYYHKRSNLSRLLE